MKWSVLSILLLSIFCLDVYGQQEFFPFVGEVTASKVNVRAGQSANFERLCTLEKGEEVLVLEKNFSWYKVSLPTKANSYISTSFVKQVSGKHGVVTGNRVNVRAGAGINFSVLGQLNEGDRVTVIEQKDDWYKIVPTEDSFGWIAADYLAFKSNDTALLEKKKMAARVSAKTNVSEEKITALLKEAATELKKDEKELKDKVYTGYLRAYSGDRYPQIRYKLIGLERSYFLRGMRLMLDDYLNYKVTVEGPLEETSPEVYAPRFIDVSKVQLVL